MSNNQTHFTMMDVFSEAWGLTKDTYETGKVAAEVVRNEVAFVAVDTIRDARAWMQEQKIELEAYRDGEQAQKAANMKSVDARREAMQQEAAKKKATKVNTTLVAPNGEEMGMQEFMAVTLATMAKLTAEVRDLKAAAQASA